MSLLIRASALTKKPVVTLDGEDIAQVKDVLYEGSGGSVIGFTLSGRGLFAGPKNRGAALERGRGMWSGRRHDRQ